MLSVAEFINNESGDAQSFIKFLLKQIQKLEYDKIEKYVFSFNMYDLEIDFNKREVVISENLFQDGNEFLKLILDDFYAELFNCYEK